jgi:hypothetical protein
MRHQIQKINKKQSTKSERRFLEKLKANHVPFQAKIKIGGREIDFLVGKYAIDIDCHKQDGAKNSMLVRAGYIPIHLHNREVKKFNINKLIH